MARGDQIGHLWTQVHIADPQVSIANLFNGHMIKAYAYYC